MVSSFVTVLLYLLLAYLLGEAFRKIFGLPRVIGQVGAGLILSIGFLKSFFLTPESIDVISFLANLGILLLFYYAGLETNLRAFTKNIKKSLLISLFNTTIPFIAGFLVMRFLFHFNMVISLLISVALSVSAQSVSLDFLEELKMVRSKLGNTIISAGAVDDVAELILVSIILSLFQVAISNLSLIGLFIGILCFILILIVVRLWLIPFTLKFFDQEKSSTARFTWSLLIVLAIASLSEFFGLGTLIGAMIAGMIVRQTIYKDVTIPDWEEHDIARSIHIIAFGFLIPLFFVWVGLNTDVGSFGVTEFFFVSVLIIIAIIGTVGGTTLAIMLRGGSFREGIVTGFGLTPKGDVELGIATLALKAGIITPAIFTSLVLMALLTTIISPIIFKRMVLSPKSRKFIR
ncbi:MAG: cation:proton antiporter [Nanoarchaeota archaeon]